MVYLRARYYNPYLNQFQSRDPFPGYAKLPQSQNGFSYVEGNPVLFTDPDGLCKNCLVVGGSQGQPTGIRLDFGNSNNYWPIAEIETIKTFLPNILDSAVRHNPLYSNMDAPSFAALMITILHWEGKLEGNAKPNTLKNWGHDVGADILMHLGHYNASTGIANIRPSVALEIHQGGYFVKGSNYSSEIEDKWRNPGLPMPNVGATGLNFGFANCVPDPFEFIMMELQNPILSKYSKGL